MKVQPVAPNMLFSWNHRRIEVCECLQNPKSSRPGLYAATSMHEEMHIDRYLLFCLAHLGCLKTMFVFYTWGGLSIQKPIHRRLALEWKHSSTSRASSAPHPMHSLLLPNANQQHHGDFENHIWIPPKYGGLMAVEKQDDRLLGATKNCGAKTVRCGRVQVGLPV